MHQPKTQLAVLWALKPIIFVLFFWLSWVELSLITIFACNYCSPTHHWNPSSAHALHSEHCSVFHLIVLVHRLQPATLTLVSTTCDSTQQHNSGDGAAYGDLI